MLNSYSRDHIIPVLFLNANKQSQYHPAILGDIAVEGASEGGNQEGLCPLSDNGGQFIKVSLHCLVIGAVMVLASNLVGSHQGR